MKDTPEAELARYQREVEWLMEERWRQRWTTAFLRAKLSEARTFHVEQMGLHEDRDARGGMMVIAWGWALALLYVAVYALVFR